MSLTTPNRDPRVTTFRDDAAAYCAFVDALRAGRVVEPYTNLLRLLSAIAKSASLLPFDMPEKDRDDAERIDHEQWNRIASEIAAAIGPACDALIAVNAGDEDLVGRAPSLWDDLAELYRDLRHGLDLHARGGRDDVAEAIWQWRFGYESHWGAHLFLALKTVHEIRYRLHED